MNRQGHLAVNHHQDVYTIDPQPEVVSIAGEWFLPSPTWVSFNPYTIVVNIPSDMSDRDTKTKCYNLIQTRSYKHVQN